MIHIKEGEEFCLGNTVFKFAFNPNGGIAISVVGEYKSELYDAKNVTVTKVKKPPTKSAAFTPPTLKEVEDFFISKGYTKDHAKKAFDYYDVAEWKDSRDKPVKNWKQKFIANWCKDEGKTQTKSADTQTIDFFKR